MAPAYGTSEGFRSTAEELPAHPLVDSSSAVSTPTTVGECRPSYSRVGPCHHYASHQNEGVGHGAVGLLSLCIIVHPFTCSYTSYIDPMQWLLLTT